ncbi:hypothetical protein LPJ57_005587 [Coemansia sp. RSA 486]|nr:hypothetical protein LPJ57_005587 [Coemansia sp. RSA 486]KAJ2221977.1 hypothetical protein IWW45_008728 [Coemansia sp. RSA 485]
MLRVQTLFSRLAIGRPLLVTRPVSYAAVVAKNATLAAVAKPARAEASKKKKTASGPKKPVKKTKALEKKPKQKAVKKQPTKKELTETIVSPPTGPPSAYNLFVKAHHAKSASQQLSLPEVSREASALWKALSDADKRSFEQESQQARKSHERDLRQWWSTVDRKKVQLENMRRRRVSQEKGTPVNLLKDPFKPKRPTTGYVLFFIEKAPNVSADSVAEKAKIVSAEWHSMSDEQKAPYQKKSKAMVEKYQKDLAAYNASLNA